jgi:hypothetical protein
MGLRCAKNRAGIGGLICTSKSNLDEATCDMNYRTGALFLSAGMIC